MRKILQITGSDRIGFLNGLITNDVPEAGLGYAALLTPQGKYRFPLVPQLEKLSSLELRPVKKNANPHWFRPP